MGQERDQKVLDFVKELTGFAQDAENALKRIEADPHGNKGEFSHFSEMMFAIRGTAMQLALPGVAEIAGLGEEISVKGPSVEKGSQIKKCVAALWDALTTVKYLLEHHGKAEDTQEQDILKNRLQATLKSLGGARETVSADEIEKLLRGGG
ncbi:MAG: hypothetical protein JST04_05495 [Bdellovibrionales bacterium]|nr:hypothetical protein [Bdellovibrionales bacterium]